jgi:hypothetical protein
MQKVKGKKGNRLRGAVIAFFLPFAFFLLPFNTHDAQALVDPFNPDFFIADEEFNDANAMSCDQIQAFLNERKGILKSYADEGKPAAQIICEQANVFSVNPRLLLIMMQKEMGLLTDPTPNPGALYWATGCGPGWDSTKGFATNIECGSRTLRKYFDKAVPGTPINGSTPANRATAALMKYNEGVAGSQTFWTIWTRYFDNTVGNGPSSVVAASTGEVAVAPIIVDSQSLETTPPLKPNSTCRSGWVAGTKGLGGHHLATPNVATAGESTNTAVWRPNVVRAGAYRVSIYVPNRTKLDWACGGVTAVWDTTNAAYQIKHRDGVTSYAINQQPIHDAWVTLGTYYFATGSEGYVSLSDLTGEPSNTRWVTLDEAKFEWVQP